MPVAQPRSDVLEDARSMYRRVLSGWAIDAARLRRRGLDQPSRRSGNGLGLPRSGGSARRPERPWPIGDSLEVLKWTRRPGVIRRRAA